MVEYGEAFSVKVLDLGEELEILLESGDESWSSLLSENIEFEDAAYIRKKALPGCLASTPTGMKQWRCTGCIA